MQKYVAELILKLKMRGYSGATNNLYLNIFAARLFRARDTKILEPIV